MASIVVSGDTSGTVTLSAPSVAGTTTLTLPTTSGTVLTNASTQVTGPAFSAYGNAQTISNASWTKISLQNEEFDTNNNFDSTTNYRFTPTVAGYYQLTGSVYYGTTTGGAALAIYKNGSEAKRGVISTGVSGVGTEPFVSSLIYFNGSTDYAELYIYQASGGSITTNGGSVLQYFQGFLARSA